MEFVASRVNGALTVTAAPVQVDFYLADTDWRISLKMLEGEKLSVHWSINKKIYANQWRIVAGLNWILSSSDDSLEMERKTGIRWFRSGVEFARKGFRSWRWADTDDCYWSSLVTIPEDDRTVCTVLDLEVVLSIENICGYRLRHSFSYDFTVPNKDSDLVFKFADDDVYINCCFLSFHSDYFSATKDRLSVMKTDENGFPFEKMDGKIEEFVELMEVVYPSRRKVTDENISYILALADRFLFDGVLRECEKYLMSDTCQTELCLKLYWSSQYNMNDLQEWCVAQLKTRQEIRAVKTSGFYKKLWETPNIIIALFDKLADI